MLTEFEWRNNRPFETLRGLILTDVKTDEDSVLFVADNGKKYELAHYQDCCESVYLDDISGELEDLIGSPIIVAEECSDDYQLPAKSRWDVDSYTWTFYRIATQKGWVVLRFYGTSNGCYSEDVELYEI